MIEGERQDCMMSNQIMMRSMMMNDVDDDDGYHPG